MPSFESDDGTAVKRRIVRRVVGMVVVVVALVGSGFLGFAIGQPDTPAHSWQPNAVSTERIERLAYFPDSARAALDPGTDGANQLLDAILVHSDQSEQMLRNVTERAPDSYFANLAPYPSYSSVADVIVAVTKDPTSPASQRIAHRVFQLLGGSAGPVSLPPEISDQLSDVLATYLASGDITTTAMQPDTPGRDALSIIYGAHVPQGHLTLHPGPFSSSQYVKMAQAELSYVSSSLQSFPTTGSLGYISGPIPPSQRACAVERFAYSTAFVTAVLASAQSPTDFDDLSSTADDVIDIAVRSLPEEMRDSFESEFARGVDYADPTTPAFECRAP